MKVTTNLVTFAGKSTGKRRDKITKADIDGKNIKNMQLTEKKDYGRSSKFSCLNSKQLKPLKKALQ